MTTTGDAAAVLSGFRSLGPEELRRIAAEMQQQLAEDGATRRAGDGPGPAVRLDPVPLVLDAPVWAAVQAGVEQRAHLLDLVLADVYGPRRLLQDGLLPPEVVFGHPSFLRPLDQVRLPGFHQLTLAATELELDGRGRWVPRSDLTAVPSGVGRALEHRTVMARVLPGPVRAAPLQRVVPYVRALRGALQRAAPPAARHEPRIAVLSPGTAAPEAFEHAHVAGLLGYPLVEGRDLAVQDGALWLRTVGGRPERIDVLLRHVDAWWCDPLELRPDARLGTPGLVEVARRGAVTVVNGLGSGVLENAGLLAHLPALARALLGQDLHLPPPRMLWCGDPAQRREVLARLGSLVCTPIAVTPDERPVDGRRLSSDGLAGLRARVEAHPNRWVGQEPVDGGAVPSSAADGTPSERPVVLRTFAVAAPDGYVVLRGGLARVGDAGAAQHAVPRDPAVKDVWVLGDGPEPSAASPWLRSGPRILADAPERTVPARAVQNLLLLGRHAERAEATVRLLGAVEARRSEQAPGVAAVAACVARLAAAAPAAPGQALADDVAQLVGAAQAVREQLSEGTWPVLGALEREVLGDGADDAPDGGAPARVLTSLLALQGLGAESLVRDPSWRFLEVGRRLERALRLLQLLRATLVEVGDDLAEALVLESVLGAAESLVTYRRRYRSRGQVAAALELLLADATNPRALAWQLDRLVEVLPQLPGHPGPGRLTPTQEMVRQARTALRTADLDRLAAVADRGSREELDRWLEHVAGLLEQAAAALERDSVPHQPGQRGLVATRTGVAGDALLP